MKRIVPLIILLAIIHTGTNARIALPGWLVDGWDEVAGFFEGFTEKTGTEDISQPNNSGGISSAGVTSLDTDRIFADAYANQRGNIQVQGRGRVTRVLTDDTSGSEHQRFIVQLASGQTLLVAHNTDLAPRVASVNRGDAIEFYGEYEWNDQGGVMHWTHHDPQAGHVAGWIRHNGRTYQ